ncbi:MAG: radical SAM protein [Bryobacteraceae bacterium]
MRFRKEAASLKSSEIVRAWGKILRGQAPSLSIEVTRECPLRCPGCYAYDDNHLGGETTLRQLRDRKGQELIDGILDVVDRHRPLHLSLVGGDPLVRYREMDAVIPLILAKGVHIQLVTSAFRPLPAEWADVAGLNVVVSIDGLREEHDIRRKPATYERILKNIEGQNITVHCTITAQMMQRDGYLEEFLRFWTPRTEIKRVWFSIFTPQRGDVLPEILSPKERKKAVGEMLALRKTFPKLDMHARMIEEYLTPPASPETCIFSQTTKTISADLKTLIQPCQFGGDPDCSSCGCIASAGLKAIADHKLGGLVQINPIFRTSVAIGRLVSGHERPVASAKASFPILR